MNEIILKALQFACTKHNGQKRKFSGEAYVNHPIRVYQSVAQEFPYDITSQVVALLHDTLEDTKTTWKELCYEFNIEVANLVGSLTNRKIKGDKRSKGEYLLNKMLQMPITALIIKLYDRLDNIKDACMCADDKQEKFYFYYSKQTKFILDGLNDNLQSSPIILKEIADKIREYLPRIAMEKTSNENKK